MEASVGVGVVERYEEDEEGRVVVVGAMGEITEMSGVGGMERMSEVDRVGGLDGGAIYDDVSDTVEGGKEDGKAFQRGSVRGEEYWEDKQKVHGTFSEGGNKGRSWTNERRMDPEKMDRPIIIKEQRVDGERMDEEGRDGKRMKEGWMDGRKMERGWMDGRRMEGGWVDGRRMEGVWMDGRRKLRGLLVEQGYNITITCSLRGMKVLQVLRLRLKSGWLQLLVVAVVAVIGCCSCRLFQLLVVAVVGCCSCWLLQLLQFLVVAVVGCCSCWLLQFLLLFLLLLLFILFHSRYL